MEHLENRPPQLRAPTLSDFTQSLQQAWSDLKAFPVQSLILASPFVVIGWLMTWVTALTGQTYWLIIAVLGFPLVGILGSVSV